MKRWTIQQLDGLSDFEFASSILNERRAKCTNAYSPLSMKLAKAAVSLLNLAYQQKSIVAAVEYAAEARHYEASCSDGEDKESIEASAKSWDELAAKLNDLIG